MRVVAALFIILLASATPERANAQGGNSQGAGSQGYASGPNLPARRPSNWVDGQGKEITIKGEQICLKRANRSGRQTLSCAIGFRGDDEKFYGLRDSDPQYRNTASGGTRKQITGTLWPSLSSEYVESGTIEVREAIAIDDPKVLMGEYACLPWGPQPQGSPQDCTAGIKTRGGFYWAFYSLSAESRGVLSRLKVGDSIEVAGTFESYVDEPAWMRLWRNHPAIEGALRVTSLKRGSPGRDSP